MAGEVPRQLQGTPCVNTHPKRDKRLRVLLATVRKQKGLSQKKLAEMCDGYAQSDISNWENHRNGISEHALVTLCLALNCGPGDILAVEPDAEDPDRRFLFAQTMG